MMGLHKHVLIQWEFIGILDVQALLRVICSPYPAPATQMLSLNDDLLKGPDHRLHSYVFLQRGYLLFM